MSYISKMKQNKQVVTNGKQHCFIDWEKTVEQHNDKAFARSLIALFAKELPKLQLQMQKDYAENQLTALTRTVHHIHGSCCFCSAPPLETYSAELHRQLQAHNYSQLKEKIEKLNNIINNVLAEAKPYIHPLDKKGDKNAK